MFVGNKVVSRVHLTSLSLPINSFFN